MKIKTTRAKLLDLDYYTEGPALDAEGNLYFSTLTGPGEVKSFLEVFAELPVNPLAEDPKRMAHTANLPDGIAFDTTGRLWVAHYGMSVLQVLNASGHLVGTVPTGIPATSNLCFTDEYKNIYVSGGEGEPGPDMIHKVILEN